jgi:PAS domain S-box-containing protein
MNVNSDIPKEQLRGELAETQTRLAEAEEAINAIRNGEVDGLVIAGPEGQRMFTLEGAEEPYRLLIEQMSEGALLLSAEGLIIYANQTFARLLRTPLERVIGVEFKTFVSPADQMVWDELIEATQDGIGRGRISLCAADGLLVPVRLGMSRVQVDSESCVSVVATDLTEISRKEEELRALSAELEKRVAQRTTDLVASRLAALNIMEDAIAARESIEKAEVELARLGAAVGQTEDSILITDLKGNIQYVNPAFERTTGYTREEALHQNPRILKSGKTPAAVYKDLWDTITSGRVWVGRLTNRRKDGTLFDERATISTVHDESGKIAGYLAVKHDISAFLQLEEQLRQSQKMEAIGQLAGGVAHDFNNLLTAINGYSSLALQRIEENHPLKGFLEEIKKAGDRAANLTRQLLAFGRKQILMPVPLDLNDVVSDMNKMLRRLIGEDIELVSKFDPQLPKIKADPGQVEQVLVNLVVNARDAMPTGGTLTIETAAIELDHEYAAQRVGVRSGRYVMLAVSDTGTGMSEETKARIFDPFFTTKEKGKGTGLGLSTVYGIIKQSGGNVWVYSEPDCGSTFKVYLPQTEPSAARANDQIVDVSVPTGTETILLVEDEDVVRRLARQILEQAGYKVIEASRGEEAIRLGTEAGNSIDLLLTDVVMPQMSGKEVASSLAGACPDTRVLFMSGYTDEAIVQHGVLDPNVEFIQKPFTPLALSRKVRSVLDHM